VSKLDTALSRRVYDAAVAATVGAPAGADYRAFLDVYRQTPDPKTILADPYGAPLPGPGMIRFATVRRLMGALVSNPLETATPVSQYIDRLSDDGGSEYRAMFWGGMVSQERTLRNRMMGRNGDARIERALNNLKVLSTLPEWREFIISQGLDLA
jgi:hypothetical protein